MTSLYFAPDRGATMSFKRKKNKKKKKKKKHNGEQKLYALHTLVKVATDAQGATATSFIQQFLCCHVFSFTLSCLQPEA